MTSPTTYVRIDGAKITGDEEKIKAFVEFYVNDKVSAGSGAVVNDASSNMLPFLLDLQKQYPWKPERQERPLS